MPWHADAASSSSPSYADITGSFSTSTMLGNDKFRYAIIDGGGNTITISVTNTSSDYSGLCKEFGGQISNLIVAGTVSSSKKYACGVIGHVNNLATTLTNVICTVNITFTGSGDSSCGPMVGKVDDDVTMNNCGYIGTIKGNSNSYNVSGFIAYRSGNTVACTNCYSAATFSSWQSNSGNYAFMRNSGSSTTYTRCYYLNKPTGGTVDSGVTQTTSAKVSSAELCYNLNGSTGGGTSFYQNIDQGTKDSYPMPFSTHNKVYYSYTTHGATSQAYSNYNYPSSHIYYNTLTSNTWSNTSTPVSCKVAMKYTCSTCGATANETLTPTCNTTAATCVNDGSYDYTATSTTY